MVDRHIAWIADSSTRRTTAASARDQIAVDAVVALRADTREYAIATDQARPLIATTAYLGELEVLQSADARMETSRD